MFINTILNAKGGGRCQKVRRHAPGPDLQFQGSFADEVTGAPFAMFYFWGPLERSRPCAAAPSAQC